jgi:hypothetical protein
MPESVRALLTLHIVNHPSSRGVVLVQLASQEQSRSLMPRALLALWRMADFEVLAIA